MEEEEKLYNHAIPAKGEDAEDLEEFIKNESLLDEYLRETRDLKRELMFIKESINESLETIKETVEWIDYAFMRIDKAYRKQVENNGSSKEDDIH